MKKTLLLFTILISLSTQPHAQQYFPMLDSAINVWHYTFVFVGEAPAPLVTNGYSRSGCSYPFGEDMDQNLQYTYGDTFLNGLDYKELFVANYVPNGTQKCLYGFIREDTSLMKIYFVNNLDSPEILLYNFSMSVGDTISITNSINPFGFLSNGLYRLDSTGYTTITAGTRRVFYLNCIACSFSGTLVWIESVGYPGDVIYPYSLNRDYQYNPDPMCSENSEFEYEGQGPFLVCFEHQDKVYFDTCAFNAAFHNNEDHNIIPDSCDYVIDLGGGIREITPLSSFTISPNPSSGPITISMNVNQSAAFTLKVYDIQGRQCGNEFNLGELYTGFQKKELDISGLPGGLYFLECRSATGALYRKLVIQD